jgi:hypothetical protein
MDMKRVELALDLATQYMAKMVTDGNQCAISPRVALQVVQGTLADVRKETATRSLHGAKVTNTRLLHGAKVTNTVDLTDNSGDTNLCVPKGTKGIVLTNEGLGCYIVEFGVVVGCYGKELEGDHD